MEKMGGKIRDTEDEFVGAPGRDDKTKLIVASRYQPDRSSLRFWGSTPAHFRSPDSMNDRGGVVVDWDLRTTLEGLYAAGEQMFAPAAHGYAASTGRYAGRKAAAYASQVSQPAISRDQIVREKARVYAPTKRKEGIEWKELHAGISRMMQYFCSEYKTEKLLRCIQNPHPGTQSRG